MHTVLFEERRNTLAFWFGCILVTTGVVLHLPMFLMARDSGYLLAGMPMDNGMLLGMAASGGGSNLYFEQEIESGRFLLSVTIT